MNNDTTTDAIMASEISNLQRISLANGLCGQNVFSAESRHTFVDLTGKDDHSSIYYPDSRHF